LFVIAAFVFAFYLCTPANARGTLNKSGGNSSAGAEAIELPERYLGSLKAPIVIKEFTSMTCSHCAEFALKVFPAIEAKYVDTGKVRFVFKDFPLDAASIKASAIASCLPAERYLPFKKAVFDALLSGNFGNEKSMKALEDKLVLFASLAGLEQEKSRACANDKERQNAIIQSRLDAEKTYSITGTPAFVINNGKQVLVGLQSVEKMSAAIDQLLKDAKKQ